MKRTLPPNIPLGGRTSSRVTSRHFDQINANRRCRIEPRAFAELAKAVKTMHRIAAPRDQRRAERGRAVERCHRLRVLRPSRRDGEQPPREPRNQYARTTPDPEQHGLHQHVDDPEGTRTDHWQGKMTPRDCRALTPLICEHVNPYGRFDLDMNARLALI